MKFDPNFRNFDPRSQFAIWCLGEGWCPAFGAVDKFNSFAKAKEKMDEWQKENPEAKYEIREIC